MASSRRNASQPRQRLLVVSNRLPIVLERDGQAITAQAGSGGLVSALLPVLRDRGGTWLGWPGLPSENGLDPELIAALAQAGDDLGIRLQGVPLSAAEVREFYEGFSNRAIWPLFHDAPDRCRFEPSYWDAYQSVNQRFAAAVRNGADYDLCWIHDYQLMGVAAALRAINFKSRLGFFLHIPFPPLDLYLRLPWRFQILRMLLAHDLLGFQTVRDRNNFVQCVRKLLPEVRLVGRGHLLAAHTGAQQTRIGVFPVSIDFDGFARHARSSEVEAEMFRLRGLFPADRQLMLGVDRLDYSKGIPERLRAFDALLEQHPEYLGRVSFIQVMVPSREDIDEYAGLKDEIERLVGQINGRYTQVGWVPIQYVYRSLAPTELVAYYRTCQIALVTPLKDGMNLVAKEFCACSVDEDSVLVLSEFAGAAAQLYRGALTVNPHDVLGVAAALHAALSMPLDERRNRMRRLRRGIAERNVFWWVNTFLRAAIAKDLSDFPQPEEYTPSDLPEFSGV